jgi:hypothetical protein
MSAPFTILNSRKRALVALIHSMFFLGLAARDLAVHARLAGAFGTSHALAGSLVLAGVYLVVSGVLIALLCYSGGRLERLYFGFCAASASSGLVRAIAGDANFAAGRFLRVGMLVAAVCTGLVLLRIQSAPMAVGRLAEEV